MADSELWDRVYEHPTDLDARRVLADALQEDDDPRGAFIAARCASEQTAKTIRRANGILRKHAEAFLGELADVVDARSAIFQHGFLSHATIKKRSDERFAALVDHREWTTVERIDVSRVAREVVVSSIDGLALRRSTSGLHAEAVAACGPGHPAQAIGCVLGNTRTKAGKFVQTGRSVFRPDAVAALADEARFPQLTELRHGDRFEASEYRWLWTHPLGARLKKLSVSNINNRLVDSTLALRNWMDELNHETCTLPQLELREDHDPSFDGKGWCVRLTRDDDGRACRLHARFSRYVSRIDGPAGRLTTGLLELEPNALTSVVIEPSALGTLSPEERDEVRAAVARQTRLTECRVL